MMQKINEYNGLYSINESGMIMNKKGHIMKPVQTSAGYLRTALEIYDDNGNFVTRNNEFVHRLVAKTFIPNPDNLPVVMHKDNDKLNNHVSNLEWGTPKENSTQAMNDGLYHHTNPFRVKEYEIYNEETNDSIKCGGYDRVSDIIGYYKGTINGIVRSKRKIAKGDYAGYKVKSTGRELIRPFIIINKSKYTFNDYLLTEE